MTGPHVSPAIALSASGATFSVALRTPDGAVREIEADARSQIREITASLDRLLGTDLRPADIAELRVDRGPGSYTGLRTAISFARVLAAFGGVVLRAASSLELLALAAWTRHGVSVSSAVRPVLDARRGRAYTARLEWIEGEVRTTRPPVAIPVAELADVLARDEVALLGTAERAWLPNAVATIGLPGISARDLFSDALRCEIVEASLLEPLYLMGTYAE